VSRPFSGFVFKIQANMDPDHRDRIAFVRICSGRFVKDATTLHVRTGKRVRLARSTLLMAREREEIDEAFPGDVVGLFDPGTFRIGDTLSDEGGFHYPGIPTFSPEHFARVEVAEVLKRKTLEKGLAQLAQEGAVQLFRESAAGGSAGQLLGAVGPLQFDVLQHRLATEYKVELRLTPLPFTVARWLRGEFDPDLFRHSESLKLILDRDDRPVLLLRNAWYEERLREDHPELELAQTADAEI
jgi:peptide chain release factor 3